MLRTAGVVILYYPDEQVLQRINSYLSNLDHLYIMDNSEKQTNFLANLLSQDKITYIHDGENKGISMRLNHAAELALNDNINWLLTMDQDSYFPETIFNNYLNCIVKYTNKDQVAVFGIQYFNETLINTTCSPEEAPHLITSGSVVNLSLYQKIGRFDEALFIDKVDHEYCLRAILNGFKIIRFNNIYLHHSLGNVTYGRSLKNLKLTPRVLHSPIRMYYIVRNYLYLKEKYKNHFKKSFEEMKDELLNRIKNNFLYGKKRTLLLKYIIKGYLDYKSGKMGKLKT